MENTQKFVAAFSSEAKETSHQDLEKLLLQYPLVSELIRAGYKYLFYEIAPSVNKVR